MGTNYTAEVYKAATLMSRTLPNMKINDMKTIAAGVWDKLGCPGEPPRIMSDANWNDRVSDGRVRGQGAQHHDSKGNVMGFTVKMEVDKKRPGVTSWVVVRDRNASTFLHELAHAVNMAEDSPDACDHGSDFIRAEHRVYAALGMAEFYQNTMKSL